MTLPETERSGIQIISRAASILRCLENEPDGLSLGAIAKRIELPRSTVQRLVDALVFEELLEVQGASGVRLGPALMRLAARSHVDVTQRARPYLEQLSHSTGETAVLVHATGMDLMILHAVVSSQELRVAPVNSHFLSVYATAGGKILLSQMEQDLLQGLLHGKLRKLTPHTLEFSELCEQLAQVREEGFAYDREEHMRGVSAVAIGLQTPQGRYAISLVGPSARIEDGVVEHREALRHCRDLLVAALHSRD